MRRLPPLNSLRAFESAARHLSYTQAADELNVTQTAISHQVRGLEDWLGMRLFQREGRRVVLTEAGQRLFPAVRDGLDTMNRTVANLTDPNRHRRLTVTTYDSFAAAWLVPKLRFFREQYPDIDIRVATTDTIVDLARADIDVAIRTGYGHWQGMHSECLMREDMSPVCSPRLLEAGPPLTKPEDLRHHTLLHDTMEIGWSNWLRAANVDCVDPTRGPHFEHSYLVLQAAINGEGVALGRTALMAEDLRSGRLIQPFTLSLPLSYAYYFVCLPQALERQRVTAFRDWLVTETEKSGPLLQPVNEQ